MEQAVSKSRRPLTREDKLAYGLLMSFVSSLMVAMIAIWYAGHVAKEAEARANENARRSAQAWCEVVMTMNKAYDEAPPTTPTGKKLATDMRKLQDDLGC